MANDFLPFATDPAANVISQGAWAALVARPGGFVSGVAKSNQVNKVLRQAAAMAAAMGVLIDTYSDRDALDDGDIVGLATKIAQTIQSGMISYVVATGTANAWVLSPTPAVPSYSAGRVLWVIPPATNTSTTVNANVSTLGNRRVKKADGTDPAIGDLVGGKAVPTIDDGTSIRVISPLPSEMRAASFLTTRVIMTATGAGTWVVPAGVYRIRVSAWGAGGGGGYSTVGAASGGGSGAYVQRTFNVSPGAVVSFSVGSGGAGGSGTPAQAGQPGGATSVTVNGVTITAGGGGGGLNGTTTNGSANSPPGGVASGGDINMDGAPGDYGYVVYGPAILGGNGSAAPNGGQRVMGGYGAASPGQAPGGGASANGSASFAGGPGARGEIWLEY